MSCIASEWATSAQSHLLHTNTLISIALRRGSRRLVDTLGTSLISFNCFAFLELHQEGASYLLLFVILFPNVLSFASMSTSVIPQLDFFFFIPFVGIVRQVGCLVFLHDYGAGLIDLIGFIILFVIYFLFPVDSPVVNS